ncbi:MAG: hypothetical protein HC835_03980 [Oscillatoriales cyanobacterium RM2_1_1]|nr:hypothetical protein [Oscillatoriales cyanobacterium SM2_3_0]NJO44841.1 hypothetical protein [Oscillatoriales cyanobacterium RM2_1_1]
MALDHQENKNPEITLTLQKSTRNAIVAKLILLFIMGSGFGYLMSKDALRNYEKSQQISLEKCAETLCVEEISQYKTALAADQNFRTVPSGMALMIAGLIILAGAYEFSALLLRLILEKIINH